MILYCPAFCISCNHLLLLGVLLGWMYFWFNLVQPYFFSMLYKHTHHERIKLAGICSLSWPYSVSAWLVLTPFVHEFDRKQHWLNFLAPFDNPELPSGFEKGVLGCTIVCDSVAVNGDGVIWELLPWASPRNQGATLWQRHLHFSAPWHTLSNLPRQKKMLFQYCHIWIKLAYPVVS